MLIAEWTGVLICLAHSALFSGLNLGFFGLSRLRLEVQAEIGDQDAIRILNLRKDAHFLLSTLLWGNVASNVLLALVSESILAGLGAFLFSTFGITLFGEVFPQAYFAKHALKASIVLVPIVRIYQVILYIVAKPTALLLDLWLGPETTIYFKEKELMVLLRRHARSGFSDVEHLETQGAINFLALDDIKIEEEGEAVHLKSIIQLPLTESGLPQFPDLKKEADDPFLQTLHASGEKWIVIVDQKQDPQLVLDADQFLRDVMYSKEAKVINAYCHRPIIVREKGTTLGQVIFNLTVHPEHSEDDVVDNDLILYWADQRRIITGADILGRLLRGIVKRV